MNIYLAGPMRGIANYNFQAFEDTAFYLRSLGHHVISPHEIDMAEGECKVTFEGDSLPYTFTDVVWDAPDAGSEASFMRCMRRDFAAIAQSCDTIAFMEGWEDSTGSNMESQFANLLKLDRYLAGPSYFLREEEVAEGF